MNEQEQHEAEEVLFAETGMRSEIIDHTTFYCGPDHNACSSLIQRLKNFALHRELKLRAYERAVEELETSRVEEANAEKECIEEGDADGAVIRARKVNMILRCQNIIRKHLKAIQ